MRQARGRFAWLLVAVLAAAQGGAYERPEAPGTGEMPPHVEAAYTFLLAWGRGEWDRARAVAGGIVPVRVGDRWYLLDVEAGRAEVILVFPFRGLATVREAGEVRAITVDALTLTAEERVERGAATLTLARRDEEFIVIGVTME